MKSYILIVFAAALLASCKKNSELSSSTANTLLGKWVNVQQRLDTLEVYIENNKLIAFDNSLYYRTNLAIWTSLDVFKKEVGGIQGEVIYVRPYNSTSVYFDNYFKWLSPYTKFEVRVQALHPELSALYDITYEKVQ